MATPGQFAVPPNLPTSDRLIGPTCEPWLMLTGDKKLARRKNTSFQEFRVGGESSFLCCNAPEAALPCSCKTFPETPYSPLPALPPTSTNTLDGVIELMLQYKVGWVWVGKGQGYPSIAPVEGSNPIPAMQFPTCTTRGPKINLALHCLLLFPLLQCKGAGTVHSF